MYLIYTSNYTLQICTVWKCTIDLQRWRFFGKTPPMHITSWQKFVLSSFSRLCGVAVGHALTCQCWPSQLFVIVCDQAVAEMADSLTLLCQRETAKPEIPFRCAASWWSLSKSTGAWMSSGKTWCLCTCYPAALLCRAACYCMFVNNFPMLLRKTF